MDIRIEPITEKNQKTVLELDVASGQEGFVESVEECLAEARAIKAWRPVALYHDDELVGFAMYGHLFGRIWFDRLLIDEKYQGKGYGRAAVGTLLARIRGEYPKKSRIYLSVVFGNAHAAKLYQSFGFDFNGERDTKGEYVMMKEIG